MSTANKVIEDPSSQEKQNSFIRSLQEVLDSLHSIQSVLGTEIDITSEDEETPPPPRHGSTHLRRSRSPDKEGTSVQEQMTRRNMKRPQYIGSLGAHRGQSARIEEQQVVFVGGGEGEGGGSWTNNVRPNYPGARQM